MINEIPSEIPREIFDAGADHIIHTDMNTGEKSLLRLVGDEIMETAILDVKA